MTRNIKEEYEKLINENKVFLFMKGTPEMPMCGFSMRVCNLLKGHNIEFETYNILEDMEMRESVKELASWPTYPQLYVKGELLGGCEIIEQMNKDDELADALK
jgi:monothiol glutaredoxin